MDVGANSQTRIRLYVVLLTLLTTLFAFRVVAQLIQFVNPVDFLPPYSIWHSGILPYKWLLGTQIVILGMCFRIVWGIKNGTILSRKPKGKILFILGMGYLLSMGLRLCIGLTIAPNHYWFGATLPAVFHLVLASFVIVYARFHFLAAPGRLQ